jgi:hypothetical protein
VGMLEISADRPASRQASFTGCSFPSETRREALQRPSAISGHAAGPKAGHGPPLGTARPSRLGSSASPSNESRSAPLERSPEHGWLGRGFPGRSVNGSHLSQRDETGARNAQRAAVQPDRPKSRGSPINVSE